MKRVYVVGTADTKGSELQYVKSLVESAGVPAVLVNVGIRHPQIEVDISAAEVGSYHPQGKNFVLGGSDRGVAVEAMGVAFTNYILRCNDIGGVIGLGGGGGTSII